MRLVFAIALLIQMHNVYADRGFYGAVQWGSSDFETEGFVDAKLKTVGIAIGYMAFKYFSVEVRGGLGLGNDEVSFTLSNTDINTNIQLDSYGSVYL